MIAKLSGLLQEKQPPTLLIDVQGVGYEVHASMQTFYQLPDLLQPVTLFTHLSIREDAHTLYGFADAIEKTIFKGLIKVNGVGPKVALSILSSMDSNTLILCLQAEDYSRLTSIPGVGKKMAERLVVELRGRLSQALPQAWTQEQSLDLAQHGTATHRLASPEEEAIQALQSLGYQPKEAIKAIKAIANEGMNCEQLIRSALQRSTV